MEYNTLSYTLSGEEWIFVGEFLTHGNASRAVIAAGYVGQHAGDAGYRWLKKPGVEAEIRRATAEMRKSNVLTVESVVRDISDVLNADPRELIQYVTGSCRHCHGIDHLYQRTAAEMKRARRAFTSDPKNQGAVMDEEGGEGFNAYRDPHPECPECYGRGIQHAQLKDTRTLPPEVAVLFDGIKQTKHGVEIKLRSKDAARADAARILGMNKDTMDVTVKRKLEDYSDAELIALMNEKKP